MESYTAQAINYAGHYINVVKQWWWPSNQPIPQTPLQQFRFYLQNSNISFKTKHSEPKIIIQRLCMMYSQLITNQNSKFSTFKPSIQKPIYYLEDLQQFQKKPTNNEQSIDKSIVSIVGNMKISTEKIKCSLQITLIIHSQIQERMPLIFIRNPDTSKTQANPLTLGSDKLFQQVLGGIVISENIKSIYQVDWKNYKPANLFVVVKKLEKLLHENFPFVKRYTKHLQLEQNPKQLTLSSQMKNIFHETLTKIQSLIILSKSIESQNIYLEKQNIKLKQFLKEHQQDESIDIISLFKVDSHPQLLQLLSMERSLVDCVRLIENEVQQNRAKEEFTTNLQILKQWSGKLFQVRWKILETVQNMNALQKQLLEGQQ